MITEKRLTHIREHISRMPPLSTAVSKLLEICSHPQVSPDDLARVISLDPVLTGKLLRLINSTYYSLPGKVSSVRRAMILLGLNTVVNLALSTAILERLDTGGAGRAFSMSEFWRHSICVGAAAKSLAVPLKVPLRDLETYFVCGLLHDLGKIPITMCYPDQYARLLAARTLVRPPQPAHLLERECFGIDHCSVGAHIADKWHLGPLLQDALNHHHHPSRAAEENRQAVTVVALGNIMADEMLANPCRDTGPENQTAAVLLERLGLERSTLSDLRSNIDEEFEKAKIFLHISA